MPGLRYGLAADFASEKSGLATEKILTPAFTMSPTPLSLGLKKNFARSFYLKWQFFKKNYRLNSVTSGASFLLGVNLLKAFLHPPTVSPNKINIDFSK